MSEHEQEAEAERQRQEQEAERQRQEQEAAAEHERAAAAEAPAPPPPVEESPEDAAARRLATRGAQVVLEPDSDAAIAAKGGAGTTIEENTAAHQAALAEMGLDPVNPSAELTVPDPNAPAPAPQKAP